MKLKLIIFFSFLITIFLIINDLIWLVFFLTFFLMVYFYIRRLKQFKILFILTTTIFVAIIAITIKVIMLEIYNVPSGSMENALFKGDKIIVSKLHYGPKVPISISDIPWLGMFVSKHGTSNNDKDSSYIRLCGLSKIKRNDIVVLRLSKTSNKFYVKRLIGLPGEKIRINNDSIKIDEVLIDPPPTVKNLYATSWPLDKKNLLNVPYAFDFKIIGRDKIGNDINIEIYLNAIQKKQITVLGYNSSAIVFQKPSIKSLWNSKLKWNRLSFGPLLIPKKGLTVILDVRSSLIYLPLIKKYENSKISVLFKKYTFKKDYYFYLGDNRFNSEDSRYLGLIPEENIEGKAMKIF